MRDVMVLWLRTINNGEGNFIPEPVLAGLLTSFYDFSGEATRRLAIKISRPALSALLKMFAVVKLQTFVRQCL
jgi:hypothetical protein